MRNHWEEFPRLHPCQCGHPMNAHDPRPAYYGCKTGEVDASCYACHCDGYSAHPAPASLSWGLAGKAYYDDRDARGLPPMRVPFSPQHD